MEFRRARRRIPRRRKNGFTPALIWVCAAFFVVVYIISVSRFGTWLAENVVAPAIRNAEFWTEPTPHMAATYSPQPRETEETAITIALPAICCHAVQIGVYAERENAEKQSANLRELGAAGYIVENDGRFHVLAAGYPNETNMQQVRDQLQTSGVDSMTHVIAADGVRLYVSGTSEQLDELEAALSFAAALPEQLSEVAIRFDKERMSIDGGIQLLEALYEDCRNSENVLTSFSESTLRPVADHLHDVGMQISNACEKPGENTVRLSSLLKCLYLDGVLSYKAMTERMD